MGFIRGFVRSAGLSVMASEYSILTLESPQALAAAHRTPAEIETYSRTDKSTLQRKRAKMEILSGPKCRTCL